MSSLIIFCDYQLICNVIARNQFNYHGANRGYGYFKYDASGSTRALQVLLRSQCSMLSLKELRMLCVDHDEHIKSNH